MKLFHISDLHIGKQLYAYSLREEQEDILHQIVEQAAIHRPDAILIAGDIYDKSKNYTINFNHSSIFISNSLRRTY